MLLKLRLNPSFIGYKIFTSLEIPSTLYHLAIETIGPEGPFGAKECSEGALNPVPGWIANLEHSQECQACAVNCEYGR